MRKIFTLLCALALTAVATAQITDGIKLFTSNSGAVSTNNPTHRIPAIVKTTGGKLIAFSDERRSTNGGDIGSGRIDVVYRTSTDNGVTWNTAQTLVRGNGNNGYGDAAVVVNRECPDSILVICASGSTSYISSNAQNNNGTVNVNSAIHMTKFLSTDGGNTWTSGEDISSKIYGLYTNGNSGLYVTKAFFSSGRICQSSIIKNGSAFRLYAALTTNRGSVVVYSDDFGSTWACLGSASDQPCTGGDEAKIEELPNGDVLLCAKVLSGGGRYYNIYSYTNVVKDKETAPEGSWGSSATSTIAAARCNGEIYIVPGTNVSTGKDCYIALLSVPAVYGGNLTDRKNVSVYWKPINSIDDCNEISDFSSTSGWTKYAVSNTTSAYSTMTLTNDGCIGLLYEENNIFHGGSTESYDIVFKKLDLETMTNNQYSTDDPWVGKVVMLKAKILKSGTTSSFYLHDVPVENSNNIKLEVVAEKDLPSVPDYSYYWVINRDQDKPYYYLSSYKGDGYLAKTNATNGATGESQPNAVGASADYTKDFHVRGFVKKGVNQNNKGLSTATLKNIAVTGYAINFMDQFDSNKNKYVAVSEAGAVNWYDHTTTGNNNNSTTQWSTDFDIVEVTRDNSNVNDYGTFTAPKRFGWPVKLTRSDDGKAVVEGEDYNYYATLRLPFAVVLPDGVEAYRCSKPEETYNTLVGLEKIELQGNVLPRETPVLLCQKHNEGDTDITKTHYLSIANAQPMLETTGFKGTLGKYNFSYNKEYDPDVKHNYFILSKKNGRVAFYYLNDKVLAANKAYYVYTGEAEAQQLSFTFDGETTGIGSIVLPATYDSSAPLYDLSGRRVTGTPRPGVYVRAGRKFVVTK